ncbi:MAG: DEAD/DEAH box helicase family protein [Rhabdochlamydiaceae bacterium]
MKLKFDAGLSYQLDAIQSVTDLFEGLPPITMQGSLNIHFARKQDELLQELGIGNHCLMCGDLLLNNLQSIQERNRLPKSSVIEKSNGTPHFSIEMETGTGKTYVYLRTIFELHRKHGFKKFVIVVPSVAVREGVLSSIALMRDHFDSLYDKIPFDHFVYSSNDLSRVRQFALNNSIQIMIINIQAFQKELNIINQEQDKMSGRRPIDYIEATSPIVIIDEPQSVDNTDKARQAITTLNPLFCLRYSATHLTPYNLLYKLDPIRAYDMRLVKRIEVDSVRADNNFNGVFLRIDKIGYAKGAKTPHAKATIFDDGSKEKKITLHQGTNVSAHTDRPGYDGYIVANISSEKGLERVEFSNGKIIPVKQEEGGMGDELLKAQIHRTIEEHFHKEYRLKDKGIKVLSLFFVDKVAHYRLYDDQGKAQKGKFAEWFEESYQKISQRPIYAGLIPFDVEKLHDGYFSADRKKNQIVDTNGSTKADDDTYKLIMKDKERLLSQEEPLRFIFTHSALKEGWDNPNIFQICSLRDMGVERERRQTLGRGLRLPVNQCGDRIHDDAINRLTVIASESFHDYAKGLQDDIENDLGIKFGRIEPTTFSSLFNGAISKEIWVVLENQGYIDQQGRITDKFTPEKPGFQLELPEALQHMSSNIIDELKRHIFKDRIVNARERRTLKYNKQIELNEDFKILWEKISKKTRYFVEFETRDLIRNAIAKICKMDSIRPVSILIDKTEIDINKAGVEGGRVLDSKTAMVTISYALPDILAFLQRETELTRGTLVEILKQSGRLQDFLVNPQAFMTQIAKLITRTLHETVSQGIKYEQIEDQCYEMRLFQHEEIVGYLNNLYEVQSEDNRTPYDCVPFDSELERQVAEGLDSNKRVKFFCKLPREFIVPTPLGNYNPDWAVSIEDDEKLYLIRETKSTHDASKRRETENLKTDCGKAHFEALGVNFKIATNIREMLDK